MGSSVIFAGTKVKSLKSTLSLNGGADVISSATDPTSSAYDAPIGAILLNTVNGNVYRKLDAGSSTNWALIQSGSGGINYVTNGEFEVNSTGFSTYADGAAAPVDGGGGSPTLTFARTTSSPLRGTGSGLLTPGALGNGVAYGFTISRADFARMIKISFDYEIGTYASYTDGDVGVYIISASDSGFTTNIEVVQCTPYKVLKVSGQETFETVFQSHASNQYYRVCFHQITSATGYTLKIDNVLVGPQSVAYGAPVTDWKTYTVSITGSVSNPTKGTTSTDQGYYRRVGDSVEIRWEYNQTGAGSAGSGDYLFSLPPGLSVDTAKLGTGSPNRQQSLGEWIGQANNSDGSNGSVVYGNSTAFRLFKITSAGGAMVGSGSFPLSESTGVRFGVNCIIPILGWSSNVEVSSEASTRVVAFRGYMSGSPTVADSTFSDVPYNNKEYDTHGAFNTSNYTYTVPVAGYYRISAWLSTLGGSWSGTEQQRIVLYKNGSAVRTIYDVPQSSWNFPFISIATQINCIAGDTLKIVYRHTEGSTLSYNTSSSTENSFEIERISGPSQIAASELVGVDYTGNGGTSITAAVTNIDFTTKVQDTHAAWSGTVFTAPKSGFYEFSGSVYSGNSNYVINLYKNGSLYRIARYATAASTRREFLVSLYLLAGETASLRTDTNITLVTSSSDHWLMIKSLNN